MVRKGKETMKPTPAHNGPKRFVFKKGPSSPKSPGKSHMPSRMWLMKCRYSKDCDFGKKGELTGNNYLAYKPSVGACNERAREGRHRERHPR